MSLADVAIRAAAPAYNAVHADTWTLLGVGALAGTTFIADMQSEPVLALDTDLGSDARERSFLYLDVAEWNRLKAAALVANSTKPPLDRGGIVSGKGAQWQLIGDIDDNPANDRVKFEVKKIVPGKDS